MMEAEYYYSREGERFGPVPGEQLKQLAATGQLEPHDLVWKQGMANWVEAARVKGLFPSAPQPPEIGAPTAAPQSRDDGGPTPASPPAAGRARDAEESEGAKRARQAKDAAMAAGTDAVKAFKVLVKNPVGGLKEAYETLGPTSAMSVGIVFAVVSIVAIIVGFLLMFSVLPLSLGFSFYLRLTLMAVIMIGVAIGACAAARGIFRGEGGVQANVFLSGAAHLPAGIAVMLAGLFVKVPLLASVVELIGLSMVTMMLYSGCVALLQLKEVVATFLIPLILVADLVLWRIIIVSAMTLAL